jgi:hypothetical protein
MLELPTMKLFTVLCLFLVLESSCDALSLFATRRFLNVTLPDEPTKCFSAKCEAGDFAGCVGILDFYVEGQCEPIASGNSPNEGAGSTIYEFFNGTHLCSRRFTDPYCQESEAPKENYMEGCSSLRDTSVCQNTYREEIILKDYCIESSEPSGDYIVPFMERRVYTNEENCRAKSEAFTSSMHPLGVCTPVATKVGMERVQGGAIRTCIGSVVAVNTFSDRTCAEKHPDMATPYYEVPTDCTKDQRYYPEETYVEYSLCDTGPTIFCKDLSPVGGVAQVDGASLNETSGAWLVNVLTALLAVIVQVVV